MGSGRTAIVLLLLLGACEAEADKSGAWLIMGTATNEGRVQHASAARYETLSDCVAALAIIQPDYRPGETVTIMPMCSDRKPKWWLK